MENILENLPKIMLDIDKNAANFICEYINYVLEKYREKLDKIYLDRFFVYGDFKKIQQIDLIIVSKKSIPVQELKKMDNDISKFKHELQKKYNYSYLLDIIIDYDNYFEKEHSVVLFQNEN